MRQRVDLHVAADLGRGLDAGERVHAVDVHRARAADALAAGAAEGERGVDLVLDFDQRVENHRPAGRQVHVVGVHARVEAVLGIPAVDLEGARHARARRRREVLARLDAGVLGKVEIGHLTIPAVVGAA